MMHVCFDFLPHMQYICQSSYLLSCLPNCLFLSPSTKLFSNMFQSILSSITISSSLLHLPHSKSILTVHHFPFCFLASQCFPNKKPGQGANSPRSPNVAKSQDSAGALPFGDHSKLISQLRGPIM